MQDKDWNEYYESITERRNAIQFCGFAVVVSVGDDDVAEMEIKVANRSRVENVVAMHRVEEYKERQSEGVVT